MPTIVNTGRKIKFFPVHGKVRRFGFTNLHWRSINSDTQFSSNRHLFDLQKDQGKGVGKASD
jgi:hypothetical protein